MGSACSSTALRALSARLLRRLVSTLRLTPSLVSNAPFGRFQLRPFEPRLAALNEPKPAAAVLTLAAAPRDD